MTEKKKEPANIHEAILAVYQQIGYVPKLGKVDAGKFSYKYAGEAEFIAAIRPAMIEAGVYESASSMEVVYNEREQSEKVLLVDKVQKLVTVFQYRVVIKCVYRFLHAPSQTYIDVPAFGEGMDTGDKSFNKAMTGALKYAMRQLFLIETGDDPDKYASKEDGGVEDKPSSDPSNVPLHHSFKTAKARTELMKELLADISATDDVDFYVNSRLEDIKRCANGHQETQDTFNMAAKARKKELAALDLSTITK